MSLRTLKKIRNLKGKRVLLRTDFNVPLKNGKVVESYRLEQTVPTLNYLTKRGAGVVIVSHLGRPKGYDKKLSLAPVAKILEKLLGRPVQFIPFKNETGFLKAVKYLNVAPGSVVLLENIRFLPDEDKNSGRLSKQLSVLADYFVSDCFAVSHRSTASVSGVAKLLPSCAGLLMEKEVTTLTKIMRQPKQPLVVLIGGAKAETKIPLIKKFIPVADKILVTGGVANTYWAAVGNKIGQSLVDKNKYAEIKKLCSAKNIILPIDVVVGDQAGKKVRLETLGKKLHLKPSEAIMDTGPATVRMFAAELKKAATIIWNGAVGRFEVKPYHFGTFALARLLAGRSKGRAYGVVGGGETVQVIRDLNLADDIDFISTGGGAMLEFLGGSKLPGVAAVSN